MRLILASLSILALVGCSSSPAPVSSPDFMWPVEKVRLTQKFKNSGKRHLGIDLGAYKNAPIYAAADGVVIYVGRDFSGFGKLIIIEHQGDRWATFYAHLNKFNVKEGQRVRKGKMIGKMGNTGRSTGVHLHFEIRYNRTPVDPLLFLPKEVFLTRH